MTGEHESLRAGILRTSLPHKYAPKVLRAVIDAGTNLSLVVRSLRYILIIIKTTKLETHLHTVY